MKSRLAASDEDFIIGADPSDRILFYITFSSSLFSAAFGMTKYFQHGPFRLIPKRKYFGGFFFLFISISNCLIGKGLSLAANQNVVVTSVDNTVCDKINITKKEIGLSSYQTVCKYEYYEFTFPSELNFPGFDSAVPKTNSKPSSLPWFSLFIK